MMADMHEKVRYLVRTLIKTDREGNKASYSLVYFEGERLMDWCGNIRYVNVRIFPFDKERAGYVFRESLIYSE